LPKCLDICAELAPIPAGSGALTALALSDPPYGMRMASVWQAYGIASGGTSTGKG